MNLVRAFIAVEISPRLKEKLHTETGSLRGALPRAIVRWVNVDNIHLTFKFLGDTPLNELEALKGYLTEEVAEQTPFELTVGGIGVFASFSRPRVVWAGVGVDGALRSLHKSVETAASRMGREPERRPFSPHLTLGRVQRRISRADKDQIRDAVLSHERLDFGTMQVNSIHLFESKLKSTGAVYRSLFRANLEG